VTASGFRFRSPAGAVILAGLLLLLFAAGSWLKRLATRPAESLPDLGAVPAFEARDAGGKRWTGRDLTGKIWIADAVTADCGGCLVRNLRVADLQTSFAKADVVLLTFVSDPNLRSAEKLDELARAFGAEPGRWVFVAGDPPFPGDRFVVVDASGRLRAAVADSDPALASRLLDSAGDLLREAGAATHRAGRAHAAGRRHDVRLQYALAAVRRPASRRARASPRLSSHSERIYGSASRRVEAGVAMH
jgi:hypothetical protein